MKKLLAKYLLAGLAAAFLVASPLAAPAQAEWTVPLPEKPDAKDRSSRAERPAKPVLAYGGDTSERSIAVDGNVNFTLCVVQGNLRINGWSRNEVRVFVRDGSRVNFKVREKEMKTGKPVWISAVGFDPKKINKSYPDCLWGEIEIDVPTGAAVDVTGQETRTSIDTVKKVSVKNVGGDISLRNVADGIIASTYEGDITLENSRGGIMLESTTGNIVVFEIGPSSIGDIFKAKTNSGAISLQKLEHRQVNVGSISGSIFYNGSILSGGIYNLSTSNGSIRMTLPYSTSCRIGVVYAYGSFASDIPFKMDTEDIAPGSVKKASGRLGSGGDATLKLSTNSGSISIRKQ